MKKELNEKLKAMIDELDIIDYKVEQAKGLVKIGIITKDFEEYKKKRLMKN